MSLILRTATTINGQDATGGAGGRSAVPPAPQLNPSVFDSPGVHLWGVPAGVTLVTIQQWGSGCGGATGSSAAAGEGGGGGAFAGYTLGGALIVSGGVLTVTVADRTEPGVNPAGSTWVATTGGGAKVVSGNAGKSEALDAGTNTVTAGAGLTVLTNTSGAAGSVAAGSTGGAGGAAAGGGGKGGAGGPADTQGADGLVPGGGGGGGGKGLVAKQGGWGASGRVIISY